MPPEFQDVGQAIRAHRERQKLSMRQLAAMIHRSAAFLSDIEHGKRRPSRVTLDRLAEVFQCPMETLTEKDPRYAIMEIQECCFKDPRYIRLFQMLQFELKQIKKNHNERILCL